MTDNNILSVLLVDDDDVSCEAVERSFRKLSIPFPIIAAHDGTEALDILRDKHPTKSLKWPYVILLDLNMPRMNGFEFLQALRADPKLALNVVFVLTTSNDDNDRIRAYSEHIAGYMVKSSIGSQFSKLTNLLEGYRAAVSLARDKK